MKTSPSGSSVPAAGQPVAEMSAPLLPKFRTTQVHGDPAICGERIRENRVDCVDMLLLDLAEAGSHG